MNPQPSDSYTKLGVSSKIGRGCAAFAGAFIVLMALMLAAGAEGAEGAEPLQAHDYTMAGDRNHTRVVLRFDRRPDPEWFLLRDPHRLVIDLQETDFDFDSGDLAPRGLVSDVRYGQLDAGHSRIILTAQGPFSVEGIEVLENETSPGYRMIADIASTSESGFETALRERIDKASPASGAPDTRIDASALEDSRFTVVLDAGHGGIDNGARGADGTLEKSVTLAFSRELGEMLKESGEYNVVQTRDDDVFLRLDERVRIAREHAADLFISVHADAIRYRSVRGATVYTVADKASDAKAAATAERENLSDKVAGIRVEDENREVADILVDLTRRETHAFSIRFARSLVGELSDTLQLVKNPHRYAGFRVLRAPDVPSVLLELGYLSNPKDAEQLGNAEWRAKAAANVVDAIELFAAAKTGAGG